METKVKVDARDLTTVQCPCGNLYFEQLLTHKILPALYSPTGQEQLIAMPVYRCANCKKIYAGEEMIQLSKKEKESKPSLSLVQ